MSITVSIDICDEPGYRRSYDAAARRMLDEFAVGDESSDDNEPSADDEIWFDQLYDDAHNTPYGVRSATVAAYLGATDARNNLFLEAECLGATDGFPLVRRWLDSIAEWAADDDPQAIAAPVMYLPENEPERIDAVAPEAAKPRPKNPLYQVPGFIARVSEYTQSIAAYPNEALAFAGAVSLQAALAGRKVADEGDMRTNTMVLALAGSATGKDAARRVNMAILSSIGRTDMIGDAFASGQGLEDALFVSPAMLFQVDEFDGLLRGVANNRDGSQEPILQALLKLSTSASSKYPMRRKAGQPQAFIDQPHLCVFGTAVPEFFFQSLNERMLSGGLLARIVIVEAGPRGAGQDPRIIKPPDDIVEEARAWSNLRTSDGDLTAIHPTALVYRLTDEAWIVRRETRLHADDQYAKCERAHDVCGMAVWGRAAEQAAKLALVHACSEGGPNGERIIGRAACEWAQEFSFRQVHRMLAMVGDHNAATPFERDLLKTLKRIEKHGERGVPHSRDLRASKLSAREYGEIIRTLRDRHQVRAEARGGVPHYVTIQGWK